MTLRDALLLAAGFAAGLLFAKLRRDAAEKRAAGRRPESMALREGYVPPPPPVARPEAAAGSDELNIPSRSGFYKSR